MRKIATTTCLSAILATVSAPSLAANPPSWDYMSLEWVAAGDAEINTDYDMEGYRFTAAKSLSDNIFVQAQSNEYNVSANDRKYDSGVRQVGIGGHYPIASGATTIDLWGSANYLRTTVEGLVGTGPSIDVGARTLISNNFEIGITGKVYGRVDFNVPDTEADYTGYTVDASYFFRPDVAIRVSLNNYKVEIDRPSTDPIKYKNVVGIGVHFTY